MNDLCKKLRKKLLDYIIGNINLTDFEDWFVPTLWNVDQYKDQKLSYLVYNIELRLAEYSRNCWNETELKEKLHFLYNNTCEVYALTPTP